MAKVLPDFSEAVELTSTPMPVGTYPTRITGVELKDTKAGDAKYLKIKHTVFGLEGDLAKFNSWPIFGNYMTSGKGAGRLKELLAILGIKPDELDTEALPGREVKITIAYVVDQRNGEKSLYPEIKAIAAL